MAKRFKNDQNDKKLERIIMRNWIILGVSGALVVALLIYSKAFAGA